MFDKHLPFSISPPTIFFLFSLSNQQTEEKFEGEIVFVDFSQPFECAVGTVYTIQQQKYVIIHTLHVFSFPRCEDCVMESARRSFKLIIFRFTHFFSFIHLARLCIVYYFCRFSVVQGKSLRDLARAIETLPIKLEWNFRVIIKKKSRKRFRENDKIRMRKVPK